MYFRDILYGQIYILWKKMFIHIFYDLVISDVLCKKFAMTLNQVLMSKVLGKRCITYLKRERSPQ